MVVLIMPTAMKIRHKFPRRIRLLYERYAYLVVAGLAFLPSAAYVNNAYAFMQERLWNYSALYSTVFDVATVFTALLFAFVVYFRTTKSALLEAMPSRLLLGATQYARSAFSAGLLLILVSIPFIVAEPLPTETFDLPSFLVALWISLTISTITLFLRASRIFWTIISAES